jgi:hypothetical protein
MKRLRIYLGGNISHDPATYAWRDVFTELCDPHQEIEIVNPCANRYNQEMLKQVADKEITEAEGVKYTAKAREITKGLLPAKDLWLLKTCDINVVNLTLNTPGRPMIGTVFEIAWCRDMFNIPCIGITGGPDFDNAYTVHPFITRALDTEVATVEEAAQIVVRTYLT